MNTTQIAENLLSDMGAYKEFILRMLVNQLDNNINDRTYWTAWFEGSACATREWPTRRGAVGRACHPAL